MFRPQWLVDAVFLAKQEESKLERSTVSTFKAYTKNTVNTEIKPSYYANYGTRKEVNMGRSTLTSKQIMERGAQGLCFHCDDKYHPGKECKARLYAMWGEDEGSDSEEEGEVVKGMEEMAFEEKCGPGEISLNAIVGNQTPSTIRLQGTVKKQKVSILIDSGSTHSFVDTKLVKHSGIKAEIVPTLVVSVAGGSKLVSDTACKNLDYNIQGSLFSSELRLFLLGGSDMVLGVDWLKNYNPVTFDYQNLSITILKEGKRVVLQGGTRKAA